MQEIIRYLTAANVERETISENGRSKKTDVVEWWNTVGKSHYPTVYKVARKHMVIPATREVISQILFVPFFQQEGLGLH